MKVVLVVLFTLLAIPASLILLGYYYRAHECVRLENGAALGYGAVFDLGKPLLAPIVVPKLPDGRPIMGEQMYNLRITDTSIYGVTDPEDGPRVHFAWRADAGVVLQNDDPKGYDDIVSTAGHANWDIDIGNIDAGALMFRLLKDGRLPKVWCKTRWVTW